MKPLALHPGWLAAALLTGGVTLLPADNTVPDSPAQVRSVFVVPTSPTAGRDPFYPESTRVFDQLLATTRTNAVVAAPPLTVPGISGTPGHLLAIINNHTFGQGDEGDVLTPSGRVHIHCLEVHADHVVVEINGHTHRINLGN